MDERAIFDEPPVLGFQRNGSHPSDSGIDISKPPKKHWLRRLYVTLRRLVRKRQESAAMREARWLSNKIVAAEQRQSEIVKHDADAKVEEVRTATAKEIAVMAKRIANRDAALDEMRQKMERQKADYDYSLNQKESDIRDLVDLQIPSLEKKLKVAMMHIEHLEMLHANKVALTEMLIALNNQKIVDADSPVNENQARAMQQLLRGDR